MNALERKTSVRLALPSKGQLEAPTFAFLERCGLPVSKTNPRQYVARMPAFPEVEVLFQRPADIFAKVRDGDVALGITGYDVVAEGQSDGDDVLLLLERLGYGGCDLVLAVPEGWLDVNTMGDLADLALEWWDAGRPLRVATKYPNLVRAFLYRKDVHHFTLVEAAGAIEAAPAIGYAHLIADITATGTTLRENRLKQLDDGTILHSEACLIANRALLQQEAGAVHVAEGMLEVIEAHQRGRGFRLVLANIDSKDPAALTRRIHARPAVRGLRGPSIIPIYDANGDLVALTVNVVVPEHNLAEVVREFRALGSTDVIVSPVDYIFGGVAEAVERLRRALGKAG